MLISEDLLLAHGATYENHAANQRIFREGDIPKYYFQIVRGTVELNNHHLDGRQFTQDILSEGQGFGESLLFIDKPYPMNAVAKTDCGVLKLSKTDFLDMISQNPKVSSNIVKCLADRSYYECLMLFHISAHDPIFKIKTLINYIKGYSADHIQYSFQVPLTRQQLANLTGLRIETVIRAVKKMEKEKIIKIISRKIFY